MLLDPPHLSFCIYIVYVWLSDSASLTAYAIPPQQLVGIEWILQVPNGIMHLLFVFSHFYNSC